MGYSAREVAKLIGLSVRDVHAYVRSGFLSPERGPDGAPRFSFQDVVLLRTAKGLVGAQIAPARVRRALARLRQRLPNGRPLTGVAISAEGNRIVVRDGGSRFDPESGQVLFDFQVADLARDAGEIRPLRKREPEAAATDRDETHRRAEEHYQEGAAHEDDGDLDGAVRAYEAALALDGEHAEALIDLGRLMHDRGEPVAAVRLYERALAVRPDEPIAAFNLGVALEELGCLEEAVGAYLRAIAADPRAADAHYNLAGVYERLGDGAAALRHLRTYKKLTGR
jgi:tetratricopeptide (TPR) repeat protein